MPRGVAEGRDEEDAAVAEDVVLALHGAVTHAARSQSSSLGL